MQQGLPLLQEFDQGQAQLNEVKLQQAICHMQVTFACNSSEYVCGCAAHVTVIYLLACGMFVEIANINL